MYIRQSFGALLLAGLLLPLVSCGGTDPSLTSIVISPPTVTSSVGPLNVNGVPFQQGFTQFTAIGYYTHPNHAPETKDITSQVVWASSNPQVVTISNTGLATVTGPNPTTGIYWVGNSTITASAPGFNGDIVSNAATYNVTPCTICVSTDIATVTVIPATQTVASLNVPIQYEAIGTTVGGVTVTLAGLNGMQWVSSAPTVASINAKSGLATTTGAGTTTITATFTNPDGTAAEGSATLTVAPTGSPEPLTAMTVAPNAQTALSIGQTAQFLAIATTGSGTSVNLTGQGATVNGQAIKAATWTSSDPSVATIDPASGVAKSIAAGAAVITAIATNPDGSVVTGAATYTVTVASTGTEPLTSLAIVPNAQTALAVNQTAHFLAIGTTGSGTTVNLTGQGATIGSATVKAAVWTSSNPSVATVDPATGIATALSAGVTAIVAIATNPDGSVVTASAVFTVTVPSSTEPLVSLAIVPAGQTLTAANQTAGLIVIGTTGTGTTVNLTGQGATIGTATIKAATWTSSVPSVATIDSATGVVTAVANGTTAITAVASNPDGTVVTGTATITVAIAATPEPLLSMLILPSSQSGAAGQPTQFLAIGTFSSSATTPGTRDMPAPGYTVAWYSSNPAVATICTTAAANTPALCPTTPGLVTGVGVGTTAITAIASGNPDGSVVTATATYTVTGPATSVITGLSIFPASQIITMPEVGQPNPTVTLVVIGVNGAGLQTNETSSVSWTSSNPAVLPTTNCPTVGPGCNIVSGANTAVATAIGPGTTTITASYTNLATASNPVGSVVTATASLTVSGPAAEPLLSLAINPDSPSAPFPAQTTQLTAIGTFSGAPVTQNLTNTVTWSSSNKSVATVCNATATSTVPVSCATTPGLVTAVGQGTAAITATDTTTNPDGSLVYATVPFTVVAGSQEQMNALAIIPDSLALSATGQPGTLIALGTSTITGLQEDVTDSPQLAWTSSNTAIATVSTPLAPTQTCTLNNATPPVQVCTNDPYGTVKGVSAGSTNIAVEWTNPCSPSPCTATTVAATASVAVTSTPAAEPLLSITVSPAAVTTIDLLGTAQFLAFGTFSTAPTALDITNGFFHAGFSSPGYPSSSCTAAYAAADATVAAADAAAGLPVSSST